MRDDWIDIHVSYRTIRSGRRFDRGAITNTLRRSVSRWMRTRAQLTFNHRHHSPPNKCAMRAYSFRKCMIWINSVDRPILPSSCFVDSRRINDSSATQAVGCAVLRVHRWQPFHSERMHRLPWRTRCIVGSKINGNNASATELSH